MTSFSSMCRIPTVLFGLPAILLAADCNNKPPVENLACRVTVESTNIDNYVSLTIELKNNTEAPVEFRDQHNPFSNNDTQFFQVTAGDSVLQYWGPVARYTESADSVTQTLAAGQDTSVTYVLSDYFDLSIGGEILVEPHISLDVVDASEPIRSAADSGAVRVPLNCNDVRVAVSEAQVALGAFSALAVQPPRLCLRYSNGFPRTACRPQIVDECNAYYSSQRVEDLHKVMYSKAMDMRRALDDGSPRVREFFGSASTEQMEVVRTTVDRIVRLYQHRVIRYQCMQPGSPACFSFSDRSEIIAFVIPAWDNPDVFLCRQYYNLPVDAAAGYGQTGVLVHEGSHFRPMETEDFKYGVEGARWLARVDPARAVRNADNYMFFYQALQ